MRRILRRMITLHATAAHQHRHQHHFGGFTIRDIAFRGPYWSCLCMCGCDMCMYAHHVCFPPVSCHPCFCLPLAWYALPLPCPVCMALRMIVLYPELCVIACPLCSCVCVHSVCIHFVVCRSDCVYCICVNMPIVCMRTQCGRDVFACCVQWFSIYILMGVFS